MVNKKRSLSEMIESGVLVMFGRKKAPVWQSLSINCFEDLHAHESEILRRIRETPNGGILFALNPLLLLKDVNVLLSDALHEQWCEREPRLRTLREADYLRMKANPVVADVSVKVKGLFHPATQAG